MLRFFCLMATGLLVLAASGCNGEDEKPISLLTLQAMFRQEAQRLGTGVIVGNLLGLLTGFVAGILGWQTYRFFAGICCRDRADPWHSKLIGFLLVFLSTVLGGYWGLLEGGQRQVHAALHDGPIGKELLPKLGNAGADLLVRVDQFLRKPGEAEEEVLARFRAGTWKLDVVRLAKKIDKLEKASAKQLADYALKRLLDENPNWKGTLQESLLAVVFQRYAEAMVEKELPAIKDDFDPRPFLKELTVWAEKRGDGGGVTRVELSQFFVDQVLVPDALVELRTGVATVQRWMLIGVGALIGVALVLGLLVRAFRRDNAEGAA